MKLIVGHLCVEGILTSANSTAQGLEMANTKVEARADGHSHVDESKNSNSFGEHGSEAGWLVVETGPVKTLKRRVMEYIEKYGHPFILSSLSSIA